MRYIVWQNYGYEGWNPSFYDTQDELISALRGGFAMEYIVTKELQVDIQIKDSEEVKG